MGLPKIVKKIGTLHPDQYINRVKCSGQECPKQFFGVNFFFLRIN